MSEDIISGPGDGESVAEWFADHFAYRLNSSWDFLRTAASSNYLAAARGLSGVAKVWNRLAAGERSAAEQLFFLEFNYKMSASGPLLAATLTPAFALEALVRLVAEVALRDASAEEAAFRLSVAGFEAQPFDQRVDLASELAGGSKLPPTLRERVSSLIAFRNATVHDTPLLMLPTGRFHKTTRGRTSLFDDSQAFKQHYPVLSQSNMPLALAHARRAVDVHDEVSTHIFETASDEFMAAFGTMVSTATHNGLQRIAQLGGPMWEESARLDEYWTETILPWADSVPLDEQEEFLRDMTRRSRVKLVEGAEETET
jgi:hypothetical protein